MSNKCKNETKVTSASPAPEALVTGLAPLDDTPDASGTASTAMIPVDENPSAGQLAIVLSFNEKTKGPREECLAAGVKEGSFYLRDNIGVRAIDPFRVFVIGGQFKCYKQVDSNNKLLAVAPYTQGSKKPEGKGWKEHTLGLVLVASPDGTSITPAVLGTDDALSRLWDVIKDTQKLVGSGIAAWASRGPVHKATAEFKFPASRFFASLKCKMVPPKTPGGDHYNLGEASVSPTPAELGKFIEAALDAPGYVDAIVGAFNRRIGGLQKYLKA